MSHLIFILSYLLCSLSANILRKNIMSVRLILYKGYNASDRNPFHLFVENKQRLLSPSPPPSPTLDCLIPLGILKMSNLFTNKSLCQCALYFGRTKALRGTSRHTFIIGENLRDFKLKKCLDTCEI